MGKDLMFSRKSWCVSLCSLGPQIKSNISNCKVVEEKSACIDGYRREALNTDHFKINKYAGPDDPSYKTVYPIVVGWAKNAVEIVQRRFHREWTCPRLHWNLSLHITNN
jgi:hypothetical protein